MRVVYSLSLGMVAGWFLHPVFYGAMDEMVRKYIPPNAPYKEAYRHLTDPFMLQLKVAFYIGLVLTLPVLMWQLWAFVAPGLRPQERRPIKIVFPICMVLFVAGIYVGWLTIPALVSYFMSFVVNSKIEIIQEPGSLVLLVVYTLLGFGISFQMPVVVYFLTRIGLITADTVRVYWRHVVVANVVAAAAITPSADPVSMFALAVPLNVFFFGAVAIAKLTDRSSRDPALDNLDGAPC
ncbi:MAG: twin-arginine translocase subunit TatC [Fimbriimonadaceae bacterium]|nr:twin-arginine translocase subunit TatC [Fimbriimonadaceae bacterium]